MYSATLHALFFLASSLHLDFEIVDSSVQFGLSTISCFFLMPELTKQTKSSFL